MEEVTNIFNILKDMPTGTKLYSPLYGKCKFSKLAANMESMEAIWTESGNSGFAFNKFGRYMPNGDCLLFPSKDMRDWSKLTWKKGDVLISVDGLAQVIFDGFVDDGYLNFNGKYLYGRSGNGEIEENIILFTKYYQKTDSKEHIEFVEKKLGGKLNLDTLEIEKESFKDGDFLHLETKDGYVYIFIKKEGKKTGSYACCWIDNLGEYNLDKDGSYVVEDEKVKVLKLATDEEKHQLLSTLEGAGFHWYADEHKLGTRPVPGKCYYFEMENELAYIAKLDKFEGCELTFSSNVSWNPRCSGEFDYEDSSFVVSYKDCYGFRGANENEIKFLDNSKADNKNAQQKFKPLQYVLAKSLACYDMDEWNLFQYAYQNKEGVHIMVGGAAFKECIPYAGNEDLLGTTKPLINGK